ncbi:hypothetical protein ACHAW5_011086 [Stephanodiscus triporus]|uniref:Uncharacterized protein n=1 Tax=Stephanodiscus triporus TaxID=2934178 RepID=A0ABD3QL41_9STRA
MWRSLPCAVNSSTTPTGPSMHSHPGGGSPSAAENASAEPSGVANDESDNIRWIRLTTGKGFSRILYPNPVCFLSTSRKMSHSSSLYSPSSLQRSHALAAAASDGACDCKSRCTVQSIIKSIGDNNNRDDTPNYVDKGAANNVMVLSWLTPTNNQGRFIFSINKSRYSASLLRQAGIEFTLSVPVRGMEQIILDVGSISGQRRSKFPSPPTEGIISGSHHQSSDASNSVILNDEVIKEVDERKLLSGRRRKKLRKQHLSENGVTGLIPIPLGYKQPQSDLFPFAIKGTVAHLLCRTYSVIGSPHATTVSERSTSRRLATAVSVGDAGLFDDDEPIIDEDHLLVLAEVTDAYVHPSYWDDTKSTFRPLSEDLPPYMTFLGSQTFGYVDG